MLRAATIYAATTAFGGFVFVHKVEPDLSTTAAFVTLAFVSLLFTYSVWRGLKLTAAKIDRAYSSFELSVDEQHITKKQADTPDVTIAMVEISGIEERPGQGFMVLTGNKSRQIWIPCEAESYDALKSQFSALPGVTSRIQTAGWTRYWAVLGAVLLLIATSVLANDKIFVIGSSTIVGLFLIGSLRLVRNPNLSTGTKRQLMLGSLIGIAFLVRAYWVWRS